MLSHWHTFTAVEVTVQLLTSPETELFSSSACFKQKTGEFETANMGKQKTWLFPLILNLEISLRFNI